MKSFRSFQFAYTAEFDDYQNQYAITGNTVAVAPEPISSVLFLTGGAALISRRRFKVKR